MVNPIHIIQILTNQTSKFPRLIKKEGVWQRRAGSKLFLNYAEELDIKDVNAQRFSIQFISTAAA